MLKQKAEIEIMFPNTAGIDIGSELHYVAIGQGKESVRSFRSFTREIKAMSSWLKGKGITNVVMESTGSYWIPVYEILESAGFKVALVNAAHVKNAPGRKSDVMDCQWLQKIYSFGLLRDSFIPDEEIRRLRAYVRLKSDHIRSAASHIQHMQKSLDQMNIKIHEVITETAGVSSMKILKSIVEGERSAEVLLELCHKRIIDKKKNDVILSLEGNYRTEHIFALKQAIEGYEFYQKQIKECDEEIEKILNSINKSDDNTEQTNNTGKKNQLKAIRRHAPSYNLESKLTELTGGVNLSVLPGITSYNGLQLLAEIGTDMSRWPTEKHFTSWLGLAPQTHQSGKMANKGKTKRHKSKASQILRLASRTIGRSKTTLGAFYRRISRQKDAPTAITATARKLAVQIYKLLKYKEDYKEFGSEEYEKRYNVMQMHNLERKAKMLGLTLVKAV